MLELPRGGYIAGGYTNNYVSKQSRLMISVLDTLGNVVNTHLYGDSGYYYYSRTMEFTNDGNVALYVQKGKYTNTNDSLWMNLYKLDTNGNIIWSKQYTSGKI